MLLEFLASAAVAGALGYLGNKQNREAAERNRHAALIVDFCNDYVDRAEACFKERKAAMDQALTFISGLKKGGVEEVIGAMLTFFEENFTNFDVINDTDSSFDKYGGLATIDRLRNAVWIVSKMDDSFEGATNQAAMTALSAFGIGAGITTIASMTSAAGITGPMIAGVVPLSIGAGYALTGAINNFRSKQNYDQAVEYFEETQKYSIQAQEAISAIDSILATVEKIAQGLQGITISFMEALAELVDRSEIAGDEFYSSKERPIDAKTLSLEGKLALKNLYIMSQILYSSYDLPIFTMKGVLNIKTFDDLIQKAEEIEEIKAEGIR